MLHTVSHAQNCDKLRQNQDSNMKTHGLCRYKSCFWLTKYTLETSRYTLGWREVIVLINICHLSGALVVMPWNHNTLLPIARMHPRAWKHFLKLPVLGPVPYRGTMGYCPSQSFPCLCAIVQCVSFVTLQSRATHRLPQQMQAFCVIKLSYPEQQ